MINEETRANAQKVYDFIIMNPDKHKQSLWVQGPNGGQIRRGEENACGTTMCVAGTAAYLLDRDMFNRLMGWEYKVGGDYVSWEFVGGRLLGLTSPQTRMLFYCMIDDYALDMLNAVVQGDVSKFDAIYADYRVEKERRSAVQYALDNASDV